MRSKEYKYFRSQISSVIILSILLTIYTTSCYSQTYNNLPEVFPDFEVTVSDSPDKGSYFLSGAYFCQQPTTFLIILDTTGMPVLYQKQNVRSVGFTLQENGLLSYYGGMLNSPASEFIILDSTYAEVNRLGAANGYILDPHELILLEDNSYWILALDMRLFDMSQVVIGGNTQATVVGCVIQHINAAGNVLFEWNSWDHIEISECDTSFVNMTSQYIDYVHPNSLAIDYDGNILLSSRHLNEITKISTVTGEIIWRWGGKMNQFTNLSGDDRFYGQHTIRYNEENNSYTLFDNGNWHTPTHSRGLEYELDQTNLVAYPINEFSHDPLIYSSSMGGMQRLNNGGTIVNWSGNAANYVFTEYGYDGNPVYEIACPDTAIVSYRVLKHDWKTSLFDFEEDEINFHNAFVGDSAKMDLTLINNQDYQLTINGSNCTNPAFSIETILPIIINPNETQTIAVKFEPEESMYYEGLLSLFHSTDTSRVAQQIKVTGSTIVGTQNNVDNKIQELLVYPNPAGSEVSIELTNHSVFNRVRLVDALGNIIIDRAFINSTKTKLNLANLDNGIYQVIVYSTDKVQSSKIVILI